MALQITKVRAICTAPANIPVIVVKVETNEPGLYGLGCATFTQRWQTVAHLINTTMDPLLNGMDPRRIEDIWQVSHVGAYWRNGPIINNAISGVDMALWDIKGKLANLPVYELLGGKVREAAMVYQHADGRELSEVLEKVQAYMENGLQVIRVQHGGYGGNQGDYNTPEGAVAGRYYDPKAYVRNTVKLFDYIRSHVGDEIELCHDVHERIEPADVIRLARELEPHHLFFLEDATSPEQVDYFEKLRNATVTPLAMGELFNNPNEWMGVISKRLIDYIRCHVSQIGGITPAKKLAALCEAFGVRTAWHGPGDVSPVGHAANVHLDVSTWNFGVQEWSAFNQACLDVFPGCPELKKGYVYPNEKPGLGIDIDEKLAAKFECSTRVPNWTVRRPDGTVCRP